MKDLVPRIGLLVTGGIIGLAVAGFSVAVGLLGSGMQQNLFAVLGAPSPLPPPPPPPTANAVHFVVLKGGGIFYVPQQGDHLTWYLQGTAQTDGTVSGTTDNRIKVTFPDSPCAGSTPGVPQTTSECTVNQPDGFYAYDCAGNVCEDPGVGPGSRNGGSGNIPVPLPPDADGHARLITVACASTTHIATVFPFQRKVHIGDTITWLSSPPTTWTMSLPNGLCQGGNVKFDETNNVCKVAAIPAPPKLSYNMTVTGCTTQKPSGKLIVKQ